MSYKSGAVGGSKPLVLVGITGKTCQRNTVTGTISTKTYWIITAYTNQNRRVRCLYRMHTALYVYTLDVCVPCEIHMSENKLF